MTPKELQCVISSSEWCFLGSGSYHRVLISSEDLTLGGYTGRWVLKTIIDDNQAISQRDRAVRKWNLHNPDFPAFKITFKSKKAWIVPYLGKTPASDEQIANKLIEIYRRTKEIIADAYCSNNFLVHQGKVICIDVDFSLRRGSFASESWLDSPRLTDSLLQEYLERPKIISVIQVLLYLQEHLAEDEIKEEYITLNLIQKLHLFCIQNEPINAEMLDFLLEFSKTNDITRYRTPLFFKTLYKLRNNKLSNKLLHEQLFDLKWANKFTQKEFLYFVQFFIKDNKPSINKTLKSGYTLLQIAVIYNYNECVQYLIQEGADLNIVTPRAIDGVSAICYSGMTALHLAAIRSNAPLCTMLLKKGANPMLINDDHETAETCWQEIWQANPFELFRNELRLLAKNKSQQSEERKTAMLALVFQHTHLLTWRLSETCTFLDYAFASNNLSIIDELVVHPQWEILSQTINQKDGWTLWHIICHEGHDHLCHHLSAIDINAITKKTQSTALHIAARKKNESLCKILLEKGANPHAKDKNGQTAETCWSGLNEANPLTLLRIELRHFTQNTGDLSEIRKIELRTLTTRYPHFLTWKLDEDAATPSKTGLFRNSNGLTSGSAKRGSMNPETEPLASAISEEPGATRFGKQLTFQPAEYVEHDEKRINPERTNCFCCVS